MKNALKIPLAERIRPRTLDEFFGQEHILGPGRLLRRAIQADQLTSVIFSGPPGTGKTTLARIVANSTQSHFLAINAVLAGVKDIREAIDSAQLSRQSTGRGTLLFVDEVHRFNKAQQDALLPHVENGTLILIGATTENPFFEVNKALVSRSQIFQLRSLEDRHIEQTLLNAISDSERGFGNLQVECDPDALAHLVRMAQGDARSALNALELAVETTPPDVDNTIRISLTVAEESIQRKAVLYDKDGESHYDTISAFIKSVRGSDPDAALYWLAKMVEAGEDSRFLFRRMIILASEDVGLADPAALGVVMAAAQAFDYVGMPEGQYHLSEACLYLATAPKSNSTMAFFDALNTVRAERIGEIPNPMKDKSRDAELGHGKGYLYPHAYRDHWVVQQYLPSGLKGRLFYQPSRMGYEATLYDEVLRRRESQIAAVNEESFQIASSANGRDTWLNRAAGVGNETLRQLRDHLCDAANLQRESLALDLGGHHGFLTWEIVRRCVEGGAWTRCENDVESREMLAWVEKLGPLVKPTLLTSTLPALPGTLSTIREKPQFDAILGYQVSEISWEWIEQMQSFLNPKSVWILGFRRESMPHFSKWLQDAPKAWSECYQRCVMPPIALSEGERLETESKMAPNWQVTRTMLDMTLERRLTSQQTHAWLSKVSQRVASPYAVFRQAMGQEWEPFLIFAQTYFSQAMREFPVAFDIVKLEPLH